jgi:hypothetical protein
MSARHWTQWLIRVAFGLTGLIHLLRLAGVLGRATLERAYGIHLGEGQDLVILMKHRVLLFGLVATACLIAVRKPSWRVPAGIAALISMLGFVLLAAWQPHGASVAKVMWVDVIASLLLALGLLLHVKARLTS